MGNCNVDCGGGGVTSLSKSLDEKVTKSDLFQLVYPVGSIYMSVNNTSPATLFGGTWEQIKNTFLLSSGNRTAGATGGSATHSHSLSSKGYAAIGNMATGITFTDGDLTPTVVSVAAKTGTTAYTWTHNMDSSTTSSSAKCVYLGGETDSAEIFPPYLVVNIWKRTA